MTLWAIVPVKPLRRGKSRLSGVLSDEERVEINQRLLEHTLEVITTVPEIGRVLVISRDPAALALARKFGAISLLEHGTPRLNTALTRATIVARKYTIRAVLILPADLPLLSVSDIQHILAYDRNPPVVVVVPDRHHSGTNALLINPPGLIEYEYGSGSFQKHCELAKKIGARLEIVELPSLALDMDLPEDLELVLQEITLWNDIKPEPANSDG